MKNVHIYRITFTDANEEFQELFSVEITNEIDARKFIEEKIKSYLKLGPYELKEIEYLGESKQW